MRWVFTKETHHPKESGDSPRCSRLRASGLGQNCSKENTFRLVQCSSDGAQPGSSTSSWGCSSLLKQIRWQAFDFMCTLGPKTELVRMLLSHSLPSPTSPKRRQPLSPPYCVALPSLDRAQGQRVTVTTGSGLLPLSLSIQPFLQRS